MHHTINMKTSWLARTILMIILLLLFSGLIQGALKTAVTFDEPSHLAAGYAFLQQGVAGLWTVPLRGHPVLFNAWEALPIYIADANLPIDAMLGWGSDRRAYTSEFIHTIQTLPAVIFAGRLPSMLCTVLLAAVLWRGATDIWGEWAGFLSILILCFDPLMLGHGRLATNDLAVTAWGGLYLYVTWRWSRKPTWIRAMLLGGLLGITMLTKATGAFYSAIGLTWALWAALRFRKTSTTNHYAWMLWAQVFIMGFVALGVVWSAYGFSVGSTSILPNVAVPAPQHWEGSFFQADNTENREVYAFGYRKTGRWWWYFPLAFSIKNPLPLLLTLPFSLIAVIKWRKVPYTHHFKQGSSINDLRFEDLLLFLLFDLVYICAAILLGPNIGYRHFLPVQPSLYLFVAGACYLAWPHIHKWGQLLLMGLGFWYAAGTALIYPNEISFFNEMVGGADQGWRYLTTSNTDWLQGWKELKNWQDITGIHFSYAGPEGYLGLTDYGINYDPLPPVKGSTGPRLIPWLFPLPGNYMVGSSILSGMNVVDVDNYSYFRYREPDAVIAHTLYYYNITPEEAPVWVAQCDIPVVPLDQQTLSEGYGERPLRLLSFDCTKSWIYPGGGQSNGHYVLHASQIEPETWRTRLHLAQPLPIDSFTARHLQNASMAARERRDQQFPAFGVYAWVPHTLSILQQTVITAPAAAIPEDFPESLNHTTPLTLNETLTFLGIQQTETAGMLEVETWWRVEKSPVTRPISVMAHLLDKEGQALEVADGLNVSPLMWQNGDIIVQRHIFAVSCKPHPDLWLRTGIYWLDTLDRWTLDNTGDDALYIELCRER
jgi:4-amino-4-deoxy-L-arabinose transferase-like glycosyltransferase